MFIASRLNLCDQQGFIFLETARPERVAEASIGSAYK